MDCLFLYNKKQVLKITEERITKEIIESYILSNDLKNYE